MIINQFIHKAKAPILTILAVCVMSSTSWAATFYVDGTHGHDGNNGLSQSSAWKTIAKVNDFWFYPGDFILFKSGETWREQLTVPSSGEPGNPITFGAYRTGNRPIISAANLITGWTLDSGNVWRATLTTQPYVVVFDGTAGTHKTSEANLNTANQWFWASNVLYVYSTTDPDTAYTSPGIEAGIRNRGLIANEDYLTIDGLIFTGANGEYSSGLSVAGTNITIQNCTIRNNSHRGVTIGGTSNTIQDSTIYANNQGGKSRKLARPRSGHG